MPSIERFGDWQQARALLTNNLSMRMALAIKQATLRAAILLVREIQRGIRNQAPGGQAFAPLAEVTIAKKRSSKALIDKGFLINSITHLILQDKAFVGVLRTAQHADGESLVNIGAIMEYGATIKLRNGATVIIPPRPFLHPTMKANRQKIRDIYRDAVRSVLGV